MDPHFEGVIFQTHAKELARRLEHRFPAWCALDVRSPSEFSSGHLEGARNESVETLATGLPEGTDQGTEFFVVGAGPEDRRLRATSEALRQHGARRVVELSGGIAEWSAFGLPLIGEPG